jgi:hypothetical protein
LIANVISAKRYINVENLAQFEDTFVNRGTIPPEPFLNIHTIVQNHFHSPYTPRYSIYDDYCKFKDGNISFILIDFSNFVFVNTFFDRRKISCLLNKIMSLLNSIGLSFNTWRNHWNSLSNKKDILISNKWINQN